jgi:hypothetical protein
MPEKFDYKKEYRDLYLPKETPALIEVPPICYLMVDGVGAPEGENYQQAMGVLYALSFTIKMSRMSGCAPEGYFEYVVPPLEGLWDSAGDALAPDRSRWRWTSMIRQPEFVTPAVFEWARETAAKKKPELDFSHARLAWYKEGLCAQAMHIGPYAEEPATLRRLAEFIEQQGYVDDCSPQRRHHEIYLSDPRRTAHARLKTVLRHPVRPA